MMEKDHSGKMLENHTAHPTYDVDIICSNTSIVVEFQSLNKFRGLVYPVGMFQNSSCVGEYNGGEREVTYILPHDACNTQKHISHNTIEFVNNIIIQPHHVLLTSSGRSMIIKCRYPNFDSQISSNLDVQFPNRTNISGQIPAPDFLLRIFSGSAFNLKQVSEVNVGDTVSLVVAMVPNNMYTMKVANCTVSSGSGTKVLLLNSNGCPVESNLMGRFLYSPDLSFAYVSFSAHKFPYSPHVYYECGLKFCVKNDTKCNNKPSRCPTHPVFLGGVEDAIKEPVNDAHVDKAHHRPSFTDDIDIFTLMGDYQFASANNDYAFSSASDDYAFLPASESKMPPATGRYHKPDFLSDNVEEWEDMYVDHGDQEMIMKALYSAYHLDPNGFATGSSRKARDIPVPNRGPMFGVHQINSNHAKLELGLDVNGPNEYVKGDEMANLTISDGAQRCMSSDMFLIICSTFAIPLFIGLLGVLFFIIKKCNKRSSTPRINLPKRGVASVSIVANEMRRTNRFSKKNSSPHGAAVRRMHYL